MAQALLKQKQNDLDKFLSLTHFNCRGLVCITHINKFKKWQELFVPAEKAHQIINKRLVHKTDQYLSVNEFNKNKSRKEQNITQLRSLFIDIDVKHDSNTTAYKANTLTDSEAYLLIEDVTDALHAINCPMPTLIINSGRGLQLYWSFKPVPKDYLGTYKLAQQIIFSALEELGADPLALDPSRVLRIPETLNTKSNTTAAIIGGCEYVYDFLDLTQQLQSETVDTKAFKPSYKRKAPLNNLTTTNKGKTSYKRTVASFTIKKALKEGLKPKYAKSTNPTLALHNARLADYTKLLELKYDKQAPNGQQDLYLFLMTVSLAHISTSLEALKEAVIEINNKYINFEEKEALAVMSTVFSLHKEKKVYKYNTAKIIKMLSISEKDITKYNLRTLIDKETRKTRNKERKTTQRRETYLATNNISELSRKTGLTRKTVKKEPVNPSV